MPPRVAIVSDFVEENWHSMDLVADMLTLHSRAESAGELTVTQLRPAMRQRLTRIPLLARQQSMRNADRLLNRFVDYPRWLARQAENFDLFHLVDHSYSQLVHVLPPERCVVTCHDLDTFRCLLDPQRDSRPRWFRAMTQRIFDGFLRAAHVITVSQATRDELLRHHLFRPERISVIANGVHPSCQPSPDPAADAVAASLMPDGKNAGPWLLNVGNTLPRKRLDILLRVFAEVRREKPEARLVRVGGFTKIQMELIQALNLESAVVTLPFLERKVLAAVYRRATLLVHTAEAEGFGLPLIEAMACGCPVVASDLPVLREVSGTAGSYCPVSNVAACRDLLLQLIEEKSQRPTAWEVRRQAAVVWAARYSWAENARQAGNVYRKVLEATR